MNRSIALPLSHFGAALACALLGSLALLAAAPALAAGAFAAAPVIAVTHLVTLGWITTTIMGALYQMLPTALGCEIRWRVLAWVTGTLHLLGLLGFVTGLWVGWPSFVAGGGVGVGIALAMFALNLAMTLPRATTRDLTWWALAYAVGFLVVTLILGVALAANWRWGFLGTSLGVARVTHAMVALGGWVLLVIIGVSQRLLPMFLLSHGAPVRSARIALVGVTSGAATLTLGHHSEPLLRFVGPALLLAGAVAFLTQARAFYRRRVRKQLDVGLWLAAGGLGLLGVAIATGVASRSGLPQLTPLALQAAVLAVLVYVAALYYKIVPTLVWNAHYGPLAGTRDLPRPADLYAPGVARGAATLLLAGPSLLLVGIAAGSVPLTATGAAILALGTAILAAQMVAISLTPSPT